MTKPAAHHMEKNPTQTVLRSSSERATTNTLRTDHMDKSPTQTVRRSSFARASSSCYVRYTSGILHVSCQARQLRIFLCRSAVDEPLGLESLRQSRIGYV